ncbi:MAG: hypothetical protein WCA20_38695 [Candidatus Sulfotelmatobacter sp.]
MSAFRELDPIPQFEATAKLGEFWRIDSAGSFWLTAAPLPRHGVLDKDYPSASTLAGVRALFRAA